MTKKLRDYTILATVDAKAIYGLRAESEEDARRKFEEWQGGDEVEFSHYAEEWPGEIVEVREG